VSVAIRNESWEITDDATFYEGWVGLSRGDIYVDSAPFGHYVAAWYPNTQLDVQMIITALVGSLRPLLSVALHCSPGSPGVIRVGAPDSVPWSPDGVFFAEIVKPDDVSKYTRAQAALDIAPEVIRQDLALRKYLLEPHTQITSDAQPRVPSEAPALRAGVPSGPSGPQRG
jgi:hypothetical protein